MFDQPDHGIQPGNFVRRTQRDGNVLLVSTLYVVLRTNGLTATIRPMTVGAHQESYEDATTVPTRSLLVEERVGRIERFSEPEKDPLAIF